MAELAIVGAGIGGLAAALAFARRGWDVRVYEQAEALRAFGAGIQITPNGAAVLRALDFDFSKAVRSLAVCAGDGASGRVVGRFDLSERDYFFMHRADLIGQLHAQAVEAGVRFAFGSAIAVEALPDADLVIGAGGLHCPLRASVAGPEPSAFTGQVAWRAMIEADAAVEAQIWMGPGRHLVAYPLGDGRLNIVAVEEREAWADEGWSHRDDPAALRAAFAGFAAELRRLLEQVEEVHLWGLFRHEVAPRWYEEGARGRLALLGDCAHPTLPFLAQGANLALEDAWVLAALADDLPAYQAARRARVCRAIEAANANAGNYHLRGLSRMLAHQALGLMGRVAPNAFLGRLEWLYGYDAPARFPL